MINKILQFDKFLAKNHQIKGGEGVKNSADHVTCERPPSFLVFFMPKTLTFLSALISLTKLFQFIKKNLSKHFRNPHKLLALTQLQNQLKNQHWAYNLISAVRGSLFLNCD